MTFLYDNNYIMYITAIHHLLFYYQMEYHFHPHPWSLRKIAPAAKAYLVFKMYVILAHWSLFTW